MNPIETIFQADTFSQIAYLGLGFCLLWTFAHGFALARFRLTLGGHSRRLADLLCGRSKDWSQMPRIISHIGSCLQSTQTSERALELRMLLKSRIHRACSVIKLCAPAFGVAGTMSGAWAFLAEFEQTTAGGGQPSMQGLTDATVTTWIGLMIMVAVILLMNRSASVIDGLMQRTAIAMKAQTAVSPMRPSHGKSGCAPKRKRKSNRHTS